MKEIVWRETSDNSNCLGYKIILEIETKKGKNTFDVMVEYKS